MRASRGPTACPTAGRWIATAYADAAHEESVAAAAAHLLAQGVDALIVVAPHARTLDALIEPDRPQPTDPIKTGSAASLVAWPLLGRAGREFDSRIVHVDL